MKHVWILNHYAHRPTDRGGLTRHHSLARYLPESGWRASIVAASTEHPTGRQRSVDAEAGPELVNGVPFLWLRTPDYSGNGADRIHNMLAYGWRAIFTGAVETLEKPDLILGSSPHPAAAFAGALLARRHRIPFVFEVRDLWPQALIEMGRIRAGGATALAMRSLEEYLFRAARRSITLWPNVEAYMREQGIRAPAPTWIANGIDLATLPPPRPLPEASTFTLMYLGAHGGANGLDNLIHAMRIVGSYAQAGHIRLRLIGDGPEKLRLRGLAAEVGATNLTFEDAVPKRHVAGIAAEADAFVFNLIGAPMFRYGISPNKLYDYMAAQRPVIFCCDAYNNPIAEAGSGLTVPPDDPERLAQAILQLASMPRERRAEMALAGRRHVEVHHSFDHLARDLAHVLDACIEPRRP